MSNETIGGVAVEGQVSGLIMVPENLPHYYDADKPTPSGLFTVQFTSARSDSQGNPPPDIPVQYQAPGFFVSTFNPVNTNVPSYTKVVFPPSPFSPGWTQNPSEAAAKYVVALDANGDPIFGNPPATSGVSLQAQAAALATAAITLSQALAAKK